MTQISANMVKELRQITSAGIMDCKAALSETDGNMEKAIEFLRKKGLATAQKRAIRETNEGIIQSYIHMGGKIGVLVEINCETDFVAKTDAFMDFAKSIAMHIAAMNPIAIKEDDIAEEVVDKEREIYRSQAIDMGKPEKMLDNIVEGKVKKFFKENCLIHQSYVRDPSITIEDLLNDTISKTGEKIIINRFQRFQIGN